MKKLRLKVCNIIATADLDKKLNLITMNEVLDGFEYDYETSKFPAGFITIEGVNITVFAKGKLILKGGKNTKQLKNALDIFIKKLKSSKIV